MRIGLGLVACVCVFLLICSVSAVPVVSGTMSTRDATPDPNPRSAVIAAGLRAVNGLPVDFANLSTRSVFTDAGVRGFDISLGPTDRMKREGVTATREGLFTVTTSERVVRSDDPLDATGLALVENMTAHGYTLSSHSTDPYESTVTFADGSGLSESHGATLGLSPSAESRASVVARGRVAQYLFTNTTTGAGIEVIVATPTDTTGEPVGYQTISLARVDTDGGRGSRSTPVSTDPTRTVIVASTGAGAGAGVVAGLGTAYALGGTAAALTELTPLLGGTAAVCCGLSATGVGVVVAIVVGVTVAVAVAGLLTYYYFGDVTADKTAPMFVTTVASPPHYYISVLDGATVRGDGSVTFPLNRTPPLPGTDWSQATRKAAITRSNGELWMLTPQGTTWEMYPTDHRYSAIDQTGNWVAAVAIDKQDTTVLEVPSGKDQPPLDSHIRKDLAILNAGKNPHNHNTVITPLVHGWRSFVPGTDYGLALTTDGRVFGVGTNKDKSANLPGRYSHITTATQKGRIENDRYSLGIRLDDGSIDFAGDDPNHIKDDIRAANLDRVIDVAAGPDRAIAITRHGGLAVFGNNAGWDGPAPTPQSEGPLSAISAATLPSGKCVFLAVVEPGTGTLGPSNVPPRSPTPEDWVFVETAVYASNLSSTEKLFVMSRLHLINDDGGKRKGEIPREVRLQVERRAMECILQYYHIDDRSATGRGKRWSGCFGYCADGTHNNLAEIAGLKMGVPNEYTHVLNEHSSDPDAKGPFFGNDDVTHFLQMRHHYSCGGAGDKSEEYANVAREHYRAGRYGLAYINLSWAMHFMSDVGNPWHTTYDPVVQLHHVVYELDYVEGLFVSDFKQSLLNTPPMNKYYITDVSESAQRLADLSNRKLSYLNRAIEQDPNWKNNATIKAQTIDLLHETLRYNEGLVNYVQR